MAGGSGRSVPLVAVLMGGLSAEREVSLVSGRECAKALREAGYRVTEVDCGPDLPLRLSDIKPDVCFNALHGRWGEDGCVQGLLEWMRIPYTHSGLLASALAILRDDYAVAKGRLGINNPDRNGTVFSLRQELFRIRTDGPTADDDTLWKQVIQQHIMSNVLNDPDVSIYCNNIRKAHGSAVPGIVIPFSTTIEQGLNFFGWPLGGWCDRPRESAYINPEAIRNAPHASRI